VDTHDTLDHNRGGIGFLGLSVLGDGSIGGGQDLSPCAGVDVFLGAREDWGWKSC
jgi:hypothetical protein